ncbi:MAG TPA: hypothetical protein VK753_05490, partial [Xanthomonadaceae bacterium]|nr:hypothetical protein [Xanthomonadaceae bacterium]
MELLLWRWSTLVQITSDLMIAMFFIALARSLGRRELRDWVGAWALDFVAIAIATAYWLLQPRSDAYFPVISAAYTFAKNAFIVLLVFGVFRFSQGRPTRIRYNAAMIALALYSVAIGIFVPTIDALGAVEALTIGLGFAIGTACILARKPPAWGWLATGFIVRALLAIGEGTVFTLQVS